MISQGRINVAIECAGFDLASIGGSNGLIAPRGPIRPLFVGELVLVGGVVLLIDRYGPIPLTGCTLGAGRKLIASVRGIVIVGLRRSSGAVEYMETPVGIGFVGCTGAAAVGTPVIPQIADNGIRFDLRLTGCCFGCRNLVTFLVVGGIGVTGGGETGGPALYIGDLTGAGLLPFAAEQSVASKICLVGS